MPVRWTAAMGDLAEGLRRHRSWAYLAVETVKNQYRRTVVGPWWLTLQTAAYAVGLGVLFGAIFRQPIDEFLPYVAFGFIGYSLLAGLSRAGSAVFVSNASTLKSTRQPLSVVLFRAVAVEVLQFGHQLVIVAAFLALGLVPLEPLVLLSLVAVALIVANGVAVGLWLGPTVARFRDVGPFVASILQVMIFFTPVFWQVDEIHPDSRTALVAWNPFAYLLGLFRDPLLGTWPSTATWVGTAIVTAVNCVLALWVFTRTRSRLPYWVS
jgi:ABC-type polysaccharide/polyol phosphate export permease